MSSLSPGSELLELLEFLELLELLEVLWLSPSWARVPDFGPKLSIGCPA